MTRWFAKRTVVHGVHSDDDAAFKGLKEGGRVVVHYTVGGGQETAVEVDRVAEDGLHEIRGVVTRVERTSKRISIRTGDGQIETLQLTERAARELGKDVDRAAAEDAGVVIYYSHEGGALVAHYFKKIS